jgi:transcriptional regulator with XRE-family HTH domain
VIWGTRMKNVLLRTERLRQGWSQRQLADFAEVSLSTVERAERGEQIRVDCIQRLCVCLEKTPEQLSLLNMEFAEKIERRDFVHGALSLTGAALIAPDELLNSNTVERLLKALQKPTNIDEMTLTCLSGITKYYWQLFAGTTGVTRYHLLGGLSGHLQTITGLLEYPLPTDIQNRLCILASETTQTIGEIMFDMNDSSTAEIYYNTAIEAAKNAQNTTLQAVALGRKSFIPVYGENPRSAILLLQQAQCLASQSTPDITRAWLSALEAEAYANNQDVLSCSKALDKAEYFLERVKPGETGYEHLGESEYARFSTTVLLGYKGVCNVRLRQPEAARKVLLESIALMGETRLRHKSITFVDLAMTYVQQEEIGEAYRYAEQALAIIAQTRSPRTFERVLDLRRELEQWKAEQCVKNLDEQIAVLRSSVSL